MHYILSKNKRGAQQKIFFHIEGLFAELYFVKGNILGAIICRGESIGFSFGEYKICFGTRNSLFPDFIHYDNLKNEELLEIARIFFYSIVTNYSLQSFIDF